MAYINGQFLWGCGIGIQSTQSDKFTVYWTIAREKDPNESKNN